MSLCTVPGNDAPSQLVVLENTAGTGLNVQRRHTHAGRSGACRLRPTWKGYADPLARDESVSAGRRKLSSTSTCARASAAGANAARSCASRRSPLKIRLECRTARRRRYAPRQRPRPRLYGSWSAAPAVRRAPDLASRTMRSRSTRTYGARSILLITSRSRLNHAQAALARNVVAAGHVDHEHPVVHQVERKRRGQVVAAALDQDQIERRRTSPRVRRPPACSASDLRGSPCADRRPSRPPAHAPDRSGRCASRVRRPPWSPGRW